MFFLSKYMLYQSEFVKKTICQQSCKNSTAKKPLFKWFTENPKGGPFYVKKFFISDFDETQNLIYLGPKNSTHEIWAKLEIKIFLTQKGPPLDFSVFNLKSAFLPV